MAPRMIVVAMSAGALLAQAGEPARKPFDPTSAYERRTVQGFTVLVNKRLLEHQDETSPALAELGSQLETIGRVVPAGPLAQLRRVTFWVERGDRADKDKAAEFHPSAGWLREHGYNPEKAGGVEIGNARNFVEWSRGAQPWMVLHELAHAYHFRVLGGDDPDVRRAYRHAMDGKLYAKVKYLDRGEKEAYATTDEKEYFAELSEAYFGRNDFFPFDRDELRAHDAAGYELMVKAWGQPRAEKSGEPGAR